MDEVDRAVAVLRERVETAEKDLADLKAQLAQAEKQARDAKRDSTSHATLKGTWPLRPNEYDRYARQMILPDFGVEGEFPSEIWKDIS